MTLTAQRGNYKCSPSAVTWLKGSPTPTNQFICIFDLLSLIPAQEGSFAFHLKPSSVRLSPPLLPHPLASSVSLLITILGG